MINEVQLKNILSEEGINYFVVSSFDKITENNIITLDANTIQELLRFAKANGINSVFYGYAYYYQDDYTITEDMIEDKLEYCDDEDDEDYDEDYDEIYSLIENGIETYNEGNKSIDYSKPYILCIFCVYQGQYVTIFEVDEWNKTIPAAEKLEELIEENRKIIDDKKEEKKLERESALESLRKEFKEYLINDETFKLCTNQRLRMQYMQSIFDREETEKYKPVFYRSNGLLKNTSYDFIELLWRELKKNK